MPFVNHVSLSPITDLANTPPSLVGMTVADNLTPYVYNAAVDALVSYITYRDWVEYIYFVVHYVRRVISYNYGKFHEVSPLNATWFKP